MINKISFKKINEVAYASESEVTNKLLNFFKHEYKNRINNIEDRASEIVEVARKSKSSNNPIDNLLQE